MRFDKIQSNHYISASAESFVVFYSKKHISCFFLKSIIFYNFKPNIKTMLRYDMHLHYQTYDYGCWKASYRMLTHYKNGTASSPYASDSWIGPNGGLNTDVDTMTEFCNANNLIMTNPARFADLKYMINNGPIMLLGKFDFGAHFYVVGGMDTDQSFGNTAVDIYDPKPNGVGQKALNLSASSFYSQYPNCCIAAFQLAS